MEKIYPDEENNEKNKQIITFQGNIHKLYKLIDKASCLLWNHNNHITIGKKRQFDSEENFFNIETTQLGYGEISIASMTQLFNFLMNIDTYLSQEDEDSLIESYNLTKDSYFLDIGSGFGKPVFHCAYQAGCICQGIEVVPARVEFCVDFYFGFSDGRNDLSTEIINKNNNNNNKRVYKKKKKGKKKNQNENQNEIKKSKNYENLKLKKYIDFRELFKNTINFKYDWFNLYVLSKNFMINPDLEDIIWCNNQPKIKYENYTDCKINPDVYFYLKNNNANDAWIVSNKTNVLYNIINRNVLSLTGNEIDYFFGEPFPSIKIKILENEKNINTNKKISDNIINNLYNLQTNNYTPLMDFKDDLYQSSSDNTHLLDFLSFVNEITDIERHNDFSKEAQNENNYNISDTNTNINKDNSNEMIIEEEINKKEDEISDGQKRADILKYLQNTLTFNPHDSEFYKKCSFLCNDATKYDDYHYDPPFDAQKDKKHPFTHIYSYNKLMGETCKEKICEILNNSDWKVLAWYTNERQTRDSGLENFKFVASFPMTSTGNQKFSCYVYIKKYD